MSAAWDAPNEMFQYRNAPTLQNAITFLKKLGIHEIVPLQISQTDAHDNSPPRPSKRTRNIGGAAFDDSFAYVDLLHDIYESIPMQPDMVTWILDRTTLSQHVKSKIYGYCTTSRKNITPLLAKEFVNLPKPMIIRGKNKQFTVDETLQFYKYITSLAHKYEGREMCIVLDGIHHAFQKTMDDVEAAKSLAMCAFIQILFSRIQPVTFGRTTKIGTPSSMTMTLHVSSRPAPCVGSICFLTGIFQTLDIPSYNTFLQQLVADLSKTITWVDNPVTYKNQIATYPGLSSKHLRLPSGVRVPLRGSIFRNITTSHKTSSQIASDIESHFCVNYTKTELQQIISYLSVLTADQRPGFNQFLQTIANVNLFRDAFRADVAIANDAIFITNDRMAQVYYHRDSAAAATTRPPSFLFTYTPDTIMCGAGE